MKTKTPTRVARISLEFLVLSLLVLGGNVEATPFTIQLAYGDFGHVQNPGTVCVATAMMNSFVFLKNTYPDIYGGTNITTGTKATNTLEQARDELANGWAANRPGSGACGGSAESWWQAKVQWIQDFAPNTTIFKGQEADADPSTWVVNPKPNMMFPTFDFLAAELSHREDVEIGIEFAGGGRHAITLTSLTFDDLNGNGMFNTGESPLKIDYLDPDEPSKLYDGNLTVMNGMLMFPFRNGTNSTIRVAYSESPVPEPGTWLLLATGLFGLLGYRWRPGNE